MQRIGLYGGSFDPVHLGHLLVARAAREELGLERLVFIPATQSPFKPGLEPAPGAARLAMLRLALAGQNGCEIDDQEIRRGGVSYTVDTLRDYRQRHRGAELFYLIGADHAPRLPEWREPETLAQLATFVVIPRPGEGGELPPRPFQGQVLRGVAFGVSSSQIRARLKAGLPVDWLVPPAVADYLRNNRLYF